MRLNLLVFAVIGLLAGGTARLFYPGRQPWRVLSTVLISMVGSLLGGMLSWTVWPEIDNQFTSGALLVSVVGAATLLIVWSGVVYARRASGAGRG
jgi:uncharacterized membrane protein YeaQ/YmgE (transglycosylase-associated protein family)